MPRPLRLAAYALATLLSGCASHEPVQNEQTRKAQEFRAYLNENLGQMTLDDAVVRFGPPRSQYDGDEVIVTEWSNATTTSLLVPIRGGGVAALPVTRGWLLRLTFDRTSKMLTKWKYTD